MLPSPRETLVVTLRTLIGVGQHYALVLDIVIARVVGLVRLLYRCVATPVPTILALASQGFPTGGCSPPPPDMATLTDVANERTGGIYKPTQLRNDIFAHTASEGGGISGRAGAGSTAPNSQNTLNTNTQPRARRSHQAAAMAVTEAQRRPPGRPSAKTARLQSSSHHAGYHSELPAVEAADRGLSAQTVFSSSLDSHISQLVAPTVHMSPREAFINPPSSIMIRSLNLSDPQRSPAIHLAGSGLSLMKGANYDITGVGYEIHRQHPHSEVGADLVLGYNYEDSDDNRGDGLVSRDTPTRSVNLHSPAPGNMYGGPMGGIYKPTQVHENFIHTANEGAGVDRANAAVP